MSRARELARLGNANAIAVDSSNNVGLGTTTSIQYKLDVIGDANFVGVLTATSFGGDGSNLTGVAATDNINTNNIKVSGISTLGTASATSLTATSITGNTSVIVGSAVTFNASGGTVVGVVTATSFEGDGSSLTGVAATDYVVANSLKVLGISTFVGATQITATTASTSSATGALVVSGGVGIAGSLHVGENVSVGGTLTYEDVTNIDSVGVVTARLGVKVLAGGINAVGVVTSSTGIKVLAGGINAVGVITATSYEGSGANLSNLPPASLSTSFSTAAGIVSTLALSSAQDHKVTVSGISTFTCSGGTEGDSHTLRITNSGITTIGFSTYFLWPSGSVPTVPTTDGTVSLISFTVNRVGTPGIATQLLAGASVNFS